MSTLHYLRKGRVGMSSLELPWLMRLEREEADATGEDASHGTDGNFVGTRASRSLTVDDAVVAGPAREVPVQRPLLCRRTRDVRA